MQSLRELKNMWIIMSKLNSSWRVVVFPGPIVWIEVNALALAELMFTISALGLAQLTS